VNIDPTPTKCSECGEPLAGEGWGFCILCSQLFCSRHLNVRNGVQNCAGCDEARRIRESTGGVSQADEARVVSLLVRDLATTVGPGHERAPEKAAARIRLFSDEPDDFEQRVVDDIQQYLHDTSVDTTWPRCPDHLSHPLWYSEKWWRCEQSGRLVARLGGLSNRRD
jgi:hypothetical protein